MKKGLKIIIVVVVAIILVSTAFLVLYHPTEAFTDTSQTAAPEELDPATGFFTTNGPLFQATFQTLVEFNGSSTTQVVPVLASHVYIPNDKNYTFDIRPYANFSNGQQLNASSVWFSFYRGILMGQGPYVSDYSGILFNGTAYGMTGIAIPNGTIEALTSAGYKIPSTTGTPGTPTYNKSLNATYDAASSDLANILSHFNYNATEMTVMSYPGQALVVNSNDNVSINTMSTYAFLLSDIAGWWGDIVEPSYVDAHGGVQVNTPNSYFDANGGIGSGPYVISSVGKGFSTIVLKANTNYWVDGHNSSLPAVAQPAHIKTVVIKYGLSHADRLEDFDKGISQISLVGPQSFKSMIDGYHISADRNSSLVHAYKPLGTFFISIAQNDPFTDNTHFREALYDAMNYSEQLAVYNNNYNGSAEAYTELGPLSPQYGTAYYNPDNYSMPTQDLTAAWSNLSIAATELGYPSTAALQAAFNSSKDGVITGISPFTAVETSQITVAIDSFNLIGLHFSSTGVTESDVDTWTTITSTPTFVDLGWLPDYPDPIGQQLIAVYDVSDGGAFGGNDAWVDNSTLQKAFTNLDFINATDQKANMTTLQPVIYDQYAYIWMPMPYDVYFVAPDVHGFVFNAITSAYYYNMMTVSGKLTSSVGYMAIYTLVADIEVAISNAAPKF